MTEEKGGKQDGYLHLGQEVVVRFNEVIGVFDLENTTSLSPPAVFSRRGEKRAVVNVSEELPRSCHHPGQGRTETVYISQLSDSHPAAPQHGVGGRRPAGLRTGFVPFLCGKPSKQNHA